LFRSPPSAASPHFFARANLCTSTPRFRSPPGFTLPSHTFSALRSIARSHANSSPSDPRRHDQNSAPRDLRPQHQGRRSRGSSPTATSGSITTTIFPSCRGAICYSEAFAGNPLSQEPRTARRDRALRRVQPRDDGRPRRLRRHRLGTSGARSRGSRRRSGSAGDPSTPATRRAWEAKFVACGKQRDGGWRPDMDVVRGARCPTTPCGITPLLLHLGRLFGVKEYVDTANHAMGRIIKGQTVDGCFPRRRHGRRFSPAHRSRTTTS